MRASSELLPQGRARALLLATLLLPAITQGAGLQTVEQGTFDLGRAAVGQSVAADSAATMQLYRFG